jgi:hypothetical protein
LAKRRLTNTVAIRRSPTWHFMGNTKERSIDAYANNATVYGSQMQFLAGNALQDR